MDVLSEGRFQCQNAINRPHLVVVQPLDVAPEVAHLPRDERGDPPALGLLRLEGPRRLGRLVGKVLLHHPRALSRVGLLDFGLLPDSGDYYEIKI